MANSTLTPPTLPYLRAPEGSSLRVNRLANSPLLSEFGMLSYGFLEGWGYRMDQRFGRDIYEAGTFHLGRLHGIGLRIENEKRIAGVFLKGVLIPDEELFLDAPIEREEGYKVYIHPAGGDFPFEIRKLLDDELQLYFFAEEGKRRGGMIAASLDLEDASLILEEGEVEGLNASKEEYEFLCGGGESLSVSIDDPFPIKRSTMMGLRIGKDEGIPYLPPKCINREHENDEEGYYAKKGWGRYLGPLDEEGHPHGYGRFEWGDVYEFGHNKQFEVYEGEFEHGLFSGEGIYQFLDLRSNLAPRWIYRGEWKDGEPNGIGYRVYGANQGTNRLTIHERVRGQWKDGKLQGKASFCSDEYGANYWPKNTLAYSYCEHFHEEKDGDYDFFPAPGSIFYGNGDIYEGEVDGDRSLYPHGKGVYSSKATGISFEAEWEIGKVKDPSAIKRVGESKTPILYVRHEKLGFDSSPFFVGIAEAKLGEIPDSMMVKIGGYDIDIPSIKVTSLDEGSLAVEVDPRYCEEGASPVALIKRGESKTFANTKSKTARIEGDDYDFEEGYKLTLSIL